jgi:hypothetical protein
MILFITLMIAAAIAGTIRLVARDGYGRLPDHMAHTHLERTSGARYPSRDLRAS